MSTSLEDQLSNIIEDLLRQRETTHSIGLPADEYHFVIKTLRDFVSDSIDKYLLGAKEHADRQRSFLSPAFDKNKEIHNEIIDLLFYNEGERHSRASNQPRA